MSRGCGGVRIQEGNIGLKIPEQGCDNFISEVQKIPLDDVIWKQYIWLRDMCLGTVRELVLEKNILEESLAKLVDRFSSPLLSSPSNSPLLLILLSF